MTWSPDIKGPEGTAVALELYRPTIPVTTSTTEGESETGGSGPAEETVRDVTIDLTELPQEGSELKYTLTRRSIVIPTTEVEILEVAGKKVAHIVLYTFNNMNTSAELRSVVESAMTKDDVACRHPRPAGQRGRPAG